MTMPFERTSAVKKARALMEDVLNSKDAPDWIREDTIHILRHYPYDCDMEFLEEGKEQWIFHNSPP